MLSARNSLLSFSTAYFQISHTSARAAAQQLACWQVALTNQATVLGHCGPAVSSLSRPFRSAAGSCGIFTSLSRASHRDVTLRLQSTTALETRHTLAFFSTFRPTRAGEETPARQCWPRRVQESSPPQERPTLASRSGDPPGSEARQRPAGGRRQCQGDRLRSGEEVGRRRPDTPIQIAVGSPLRGRTAIQPTWSLH